MAAPPRSRSPCSRAERTANGPHRTRTPWWRGRLGERDSQRASQPSAAGHAETEHAEAASRTKFGWQADNQASAIVAVDTVLAASKSAGRLDAAFVEKASAAIHVKWLERNGSWAPPEHKLPYGSLSEPEKEKDRVVVRAAIRALTT